MTNKAIVIGGSAGSFKIVMKIISLLPKKIDIPIFICLHRLRSARKGFAETLQVNSLVKIKEPNDKELIEPNNIYIAPANYHMYILKNGRIGLSIEEELNHSRPSIDLTFITAAEYYKEHLLAIILSGANDDGAFGFLKIKENGGITIAQQPEECEISVMPLSCINNKSVDNILTVKEIIKNIQNFISYNI
jgi:two-component system chemotaxis response regulator CheB